MKRTSFLFGFLLCVGLLGLQISPLYAADFTFTVNNGGDGGDSSPGDTTCNNGSGVCTLRAAIEEANALPANSIDINFSGVTTINTASQLSVTTGSPLTINGTGVTVDNTGSGQVFSLNNASVTIDGLTITGGDGNDGYGAGIYIYAGTLMLQNNAVVTGNDAGTNWGGGIYLDLDTGAALTVDHSTISSNNAQYGGGIYVDDGTSATLQNGAVVTQNTTSFAGAGIYVYGTLTVTDSAITYNNGNAQGNGIYYAPYVNPPSVSVTNSCIVCNGDDAIAGAGAPVDFSDNWWGTAAVPYYSLDTQGLQCSTGDSLSTDVTPADRNITVATAGTCTGAFATGNWLTAATAGCTGNEVSPVSSLGHARTCAPPP